MDIIETKDNFSDAINELKDLNKKIDSNSNFDILFKECIKFYKKLKTVHIIKLMGLKLFTILIKISK
ncbi:hypothetical protein PT144_04800 (plasmid) [Borreliella garinii]|uniref:hypothetical protein n=1 Tax=Borreliella garinii TaxID=29519 RepID=UPI00041E8C00|nr:hypothetical protein [Borreliella garinii]WNZ74052.1 hypothetical protein PT142_04675 [Borreliella garinii]WNZ75024.1 hypothetical protein PT137_04625 [Borreliella garinii]WRM49080.1 hypothetical protein PT144_04800 [Borreliella garinii]